MTKAHRKGTKAHRKIRKVAAIVFMLFISLECYAAPVDLSKAMVEVRKGIEETVTQLNKERTKIADSRIPLVREIRELEQELASLRNKARALRKIQWQKESSFETLQGEVDFLQSEVQFVFSLLSEYRRDMETRMTVARTNYFNQELGGIDKLLFMETSKSAISAIEPLLKLGETFHNRVLGGDIFKGTALDEKGIVHNGTFAEIGPITYFTSGDDAGTGLVVSHLGSAEPSVVSCFREKAKAQIRALVTGREAIIPVDFTQGNALKIHKLKGNWVQHIKSGGIVMIPIMGIGVLCIILVVWKFLSLQHLPIEVKTELTEILRLTKNGSIDEARKLADSLGEPLSPVILEGIEHRNAPREHIEEIMHERILQEVPGLERHLPALAVCGGVAPLLGLLGTVTGMMHTFKLITIFGTGDARLLSSGISEALTTTEYGLMIAVPVLLAHAYLSRRVRRMTDTLHQTAIGFINGLKLK